MNETISSIEQDKIYVKEYNEGNKESAFRKIYKKYHAKIKFKFLISCRDDDLANDLASEVLIKVYENLSGFDEEKGCFNTWISMLATYHYRDHLRKSYVKNMVTMNKEPGENCKEVQFVSDSLTPLQIVNQIDMKKMVHNIVKDSLKNETMRKLIKMQYFQEMSMQEISDEVNLPVGTVKTHIHRAKRIMEKFIQEKIGKDAVLY